MALIKDTAIVLRRLDYSETSQVLVILTREHGQQRLIAKGIKRGTKKRVAVGVDLLELGRIVFSRRSDKLDILATLTEWRQQDHFPHLRRDLRRFYAAQYAAEAISQLTDIQDPYPVLFDGLHRLLLELCESDVLSALLDFLWLMLRELGLRPEMGRCVNCNREMAGEETLYFSSHQGGVLCRDCEPAMIEKRRISPGLVTALSSEKWQDTAFAESAFDLFDYHLREMIARPLRLSRPLRAVLKISSSL